VTLPMAAMSQQSSVKSGDGKDCPLSHWSTSGAACFYAPDMPSAHSNPESSGIHFYPALNSSIPEEMPSNNSSVQQLPIFKNYFQQKSLFGLPKMPPMFEPPEGIKLPLNK
jgi:hypothetical protein